MIMLSNRAMMLLNQFILKNRITINNLITHFNNSVNNYILRVQLKVENQTNNTSPILIRTSELTPTLGAVHSIRSKNKWII